MERSGPTPSAFRWASWPGGSGTGGAPAAAAAERHRCWTAAGTYVRAGLYLFVLYAFRRRLRAWPGEGVGGAYSWTGTSLSTPLATNFGPGPDGAAGGGEQLDAEFAFLRFSPPNSCLARRGRWSLTFYLSLTGLSTGGQATLGHWSQHHLRL